VKNQLKESQIKNKELQLCASYFEEMFMKEKDDKKNAEIAFKRILNKMYNDEQYMPADIPTVFSYHSKPSSPQQRNQITKSGKKRGINTVTEGLDLTTHGYGSKPLSPQNFKHSPNDFR